MQARRRVVRRRVRGPRGRRERQPGDRPDVARQPGLDARVRAPPQRRPLTMPRRYRVGVVGFGIAGSAAAYLLAKAGHSVTLLERASELAPVGAGLLLQPSGQAVLRRM